MLVINYFSMCRAYSVVYFWADFGPHYPLSIASKLNFKCENVHQFKFVLAVMKYCDSQEHVSVNLIYKMYQGINTDRND